MVLAEEKLGSRRQFGANASGSTAAVTPVGLGELWGGKSCVHGSSDLA
jgi:hypothetical protein